MILEYVNIGLSALSAIGIGYLLLSGKYSVAYTAFFRRVLVGFMLYAITGLVVLSYPAPELHLVHAVSALFVAFGCYSLIADRLQSTDDFRALDGR